MRTYQTEPKTGKAIEKNSESKKNEMLKGPICKRFQDILQFLRTFLLSLSEEV